MTGVADAVIAAVTVAALISLKAAESDDGVMRGL
jgi:hypothetical protein